ncbi:MAG: DNA-directed RNA polymerase subunit H [Candidatus Aenigmarchaeota archaeon]|nr:DNA-directed RNA polymerase subunit H [Candidatus Aenigmarchaeota archaeon]
MKEKDILLHELVPRHEIMPKEEVEVLLLKLKLTVQNLPKILEADKVVESLGAKAGDVLKITRKSPTAGTSLYYRLVVEG